MDLGIVNEHFSSLLALVSLCSHQAWETYSVDLSTAQFFFLCLFFFIDFCVRQFFQVHVTGSDKAGIHCPFSHR